MKLHATGFVCVISALCFLGTGIGRADSATSPNAATNTADSSDSGLAEIVVSARRVQENLQTVPISVTAFTPDQITDRGLVTIADVGLETPNLHIAPAIGSQNTASISIRGQYQQENLLTVDPSVGVYVDDVYYARDYSILGDFLDVTDPFGASACGSAYATTQSTIWETDPFLWPHEYSPDADATRVRTSSLTWPRELS